MRRHSKEAWINRWVLIVSFAFLLVIAICALCAEQSSPHFAEITGETVYEKDGVVIDASNVSQGYVAVKYTEQTDGDLLVKIVRGSSTHTYYLNSSNEYEVYSFQDGNGKYTVQVYRQVKGSQYTKVYSKEISVAMEEENDPFLYPNQYVWYTADSTAVSISLELCKDATTDKEKIEILSDYVMRALAYDHIKARTVKSGYVPDIDEVLAKKKGICFDYSAVFACMLRVQNIPAKLIIGYADKYYHAWNRVWVDGEWERYDLTFADSGTEISKYTQEAFY
ncbi:MAG TPA: transglutaminase-like domain-containing protein [Candidatus Limiplasma sp.]|nr:transglutaminase-like domain-containing protein [Candidatus Limiplasma sp.]